MTKESAEKVLTRIRIKKVEEALLLLPRSRSGFENQITFIMKRILQEFFLFQPYLEP